MSNRHYSYGNVKVLCDICGRAYKDSDCRLQWDNLLACYRCYDSKHPDLNPIIAPVENPVIVNARPRPSFENLTFVDTPGVSVWDGVLYNGADYNTEFTWDDMNITWDEITGDDFR